MVDIPLAPATILVVEDDPTIAEQVRARLVADGHAVSVVTDGVGALQAAGDVEPDLVVLDLMLPGLDGLEVCRRLQAERDVLVLMLTALDTELDVVVGLRVGADDYVAKPFGMRELSARVHALLRRGARVASSARPADDVRTAGRWRIDVRRRRVTDDSGAEGGLTATEFDILALLAADAGAVRTRRDLVTEVWGYSDEAAHRTVDSHIRAIRAKLGDDVIRTVRGVGYATGELADQAGGADERDGDRG